MNANVTADREPGERRTVHRPADAREVEAIVRDAAAEGRPLAIEGGGSKRAIGRPVEAHDVLELGGVAGIVSYEPEELVLTARAGTPLTEIEAALAAHRQCLAFEPPDFRALLGTREARPTLGGLVAAGLSGPRRLRAGAVRDHVLGIAAVSGRGESFSAGGRVVKNVTGYDVPKLLAGSWGTLAVLTEITLKVLPAAEDVRTLLIVGLDARAAVRCMGEALQTPLDVSGACHLPAGILRDRAARWPDGSVTALRLEGIAPSVAARLERLRERLRAAGAQGVLERDESLAFWHAVRDVAPFADGTQRIVWRLSVPPAAGGEVLESLREALPGAEGFLDWGGGLLWLALPGDADAHAAEVRKAIAASGGHATLVRAAAPVRAAAEVFHPQPEALAALTRRVKAQMDPARVLNPGRMYAGV